MSSCEKPLSGSEGFHVVLLACSFQLASSPLSLVQSGMTSTGAQRVIFLAAFLLWVTRPVAAQTEGYSAWPDQRHSRKPEACGHVINGKLPQKWVRRSFSLKTNHKGSSLLISPFKTDQTGGFWFKPSF